MRYVELPVPGAARASVLGFGCSALMGRAGRKESLIALGAADESGITFYDTARSYGYGDSESLLGEYFQERRREVVICTKFGILPAPRTNWKQRLKPLAQAAVRAVPALRPLARRAAASQMQAGQFSVNVLQSSVESSLRALRTDYLDMLLLHAAPIDVLQQDDLLAAMGRLVESGKVLMAGISGELPVIREVIRSRPIPLRTAQFAMNRTNLFFVDEVAEAGGLFLVANHPFGGPEGVAETQAAIAKLAKSPSLPVALREKLVEPDPRLLPEVVLNVILQVRGISAVVPAMMRPANLRNNVAAIDGCRFTPEELISLRARLANATAPNP